MGKDLSRLVIRVLNHAASGEIAAGKAEGDPARIPWAW